MFVKEANKLFSRNHISEKVEAYYFDEMRKIWTSDLLRNWDLFVKYPKFEDWSDWIDGGTK